MRTTAILFSVLVSTSLVAGCGSSGDSGGSGASSSYCKDLKAAKADFGSLSSSTPDFEKFGEAVAALHKLADEAPSEINDDWKTLDGALTALEKALDDAGMSFKDLGALTAGQLPEGVSQEDVQALAPKLQSAFGDDVTKASKNIEKHAKSKCGVDLTED
jgi:outer membrane murein-binding lipoprotein Lpp